MSEYVVTLRGEPVAVLRRGQGYARPRCAGGCKHRDPIRLCSYGAPPVLTSTRFRCRPATVGRTAQSIQRASRPLRCVRKPLGPPARSSVSANTFLNSACVLVCTSVLRHRR